MENTEKINWYKNHIKAQCDFFGKIPSDQISNVEKRVEDFKKSKISKFKCELKDLNDKIKKLKNEQDCINLAIFEVLEELENLKQK